MSRRLHKEKPTEDEEAEAKDASSTEHEPRTEDLEGDSTDEDGYFTANEEWI